MHWQNLPELMSKLAQDSSRDAVVARLLVLTGARSHMIRFAQWSEIDLVAGIWALPAERMKMRKPFTIPLPVQAVEILKSLPRMDSPYLFPGKGKSGAIHANAVRNLLHKLGHTDITRHGFRSTFRDWCAEKTQYANEVAEMALAHTVANKVEAAYRRGDMLDKRRSLMQDWAEYATQSPQGTDVTDGHQDVVSGAIKSTA
ncbi:Prophage integrase IntA [bioreactor metagenome]|uniref:Prophage integrase IntA n=1 Tax=bioreactor metagenome TaxID=1076179 RepID=A0A645ECW5_9ZZZZ